MRAKTKAGQSALQKWFLSFDVFDGLPKIVSVEADKLDANDLAISVDEASVKKYAAGVAAKIISALDHTDEPYATIEDGYLRVFLSPDIDVAALTLPLSSLYLREDGVKAVEKEIAKRRAMRLDGDPA